MCINPAFQHPHSRTLLCLWFRKKLPFAGYSVVKDLPKGFTLRTFPFALSLGF